MARAPTYSVAGKHAVLATMHGKERVIGPLVEAALGLRLRLPSALDTDQFGTFSREIERTGSQLDAARAKITAAFARDPEARVGLSSEGSFGPHPSFPFMALGREIVVLIDRETGLELVGHHADLSTNFDHATIVDPQEAIAFAERAGFASHGLIVIGVKDGRPAVDRLLRKDIDAISDLSDAVAQAITLCGSAHVETDMRAHRNPRRMRSIKRATIDLVRQYRNTCPNCDRPGFGVKERLAGLPCSWCGEPTNALRAEVMVCAGCGHRLEKAVAVAAADPRYCDQCNP